MFKLLLVVLLALASGCVSSVRKEYYPPTPEYSVEVEVDGVVEIRGALQSEKVDEGWSLGTQGLGTYHILPVSLF